MEKLVLFLSLGWFEILWNDGRGKWRRVLHGWVGGFKLCCFSADILGGSNHFLVNSWVSDAPVGESLRLCKHYLLE